MKPGGIDAEGWLAGIRHLPSPNFDARPAGEAPTLLVIHAISLPPDEFGSDDILDLFTNRLCIERHPYFAQIATLRVSAHFLIRRGGETIQFVSCDARAWHADFVLARTERCNDFSIGIELEGCDTEPFTDAQYAALNALIDTLFHHYPLAGIAGHSEISPGRKTDPGPCFDWSRLPDCIPH